MRNDNTAISDRETVVCIPHSSHHQYLNLIDMILLRQEGYCLSLLYSIYY